MGFLKKVGKAYLKGVGYATGNPLIFTGTNALAEGKSVPKAYKKFGKNLTGHVEQFDSTPSDIQPLRAAIVQQLLQGVNGLGNAYAGVLGGGPPPAQDTSFFYNNILGPYNDLFASQRSSALAQAKESAGNLTGSGYNNILGQATAESLAQQQALSAQTLLGLRAQELQRQQDFLRMLLGFGTAGVGGSQPYYQPGYLDSLAPIVGTILGRGIAK